MFCYCERKAFVGAKGCVDGFTEMRIIESSLVATIQKLFLLCRTLINQGSKKHKSSGNELFSQIREAELRAEFALSSKTSLYERYCDVSVTKDEYIRLNSCEDNTLRQAEKEIAALKQRESASFGGGTW